MLKVYKVMVGEFVKRSTESEYMCHGVGTLNNLSMSFEECYSAILHEYGNRVNRKDVSEFHLLEQTQNSLKFEVKSCLKDKHIKTVRYHYKIVEFSM